jgi:uncharacterized protein (TIGR03382 family)
MRRLVRPVVWPVARWFALGLGVCAAAVAHADPTPGGPTGVIGGMNAQAGAWPDASAILFEVPSNPNDSTSPPVDEALCSGTLVAPTVVLTAGHCYTEPPLPDNVLVGASTLANPNDGETIAITNGFVYPNAQTSEDVTALVLATPSTKPPRAIATGWASTDIQNGATVKLVGFGAVDSQGDQFIDPLQEATTTISDFDCTTSAGCNKAAQPDGELGAGGDGIDTCPGDSGGPLYLITSYGTYLGGVTSRSYNNATLACSGGGIYERPDKIVSWIEQVTGVTVTHGPEPTAPAVMAAPGTSADTTIAVNDPGSTKHSFEVTTQPAHGKAGVNDDGVVRVCPAASAAAGSDLVTVKITDGNNAKRTQSLDVAVTIVAGAGMPGCDLSGFGDDGGGCCDSGHGAGGALPLAAGVLALVARRRRRP